ncbi:E9 [Gull papillomavirus 1]|uniref:E9 n=1 Tax=Gull papillomavirus 1 TaxID=2562547 RepID=A0AAE6D339_9PAPI|nr:E9 [Gull papillomavirus 1]
MTVITEHCSTSNSDGMIIMFFPNWDTCFILRSDVTTTEEDMVVLTMQVATPEQNRRACATALYSALQKCAIYYGVGCLHRTLPVLYRRLQGRWTGTPLDPRVQFLVDLCKDSERMLAARMPFEKLRILIPLARLYDLYWLLSPTRAETREHAAFIRNSLTVAKALREERHKSRMRRRGHSYFNAY